MTAGCIVPQSGPGAAGLPDAVAAHLEWLESAGYARATVANRRAALRAFGRWAAHRGEPALSDLTPALLECYRRWVFAVRRPDGRPLSWGAQAARLLAVRRFCAWAARAGVLYQNPAADFPLPRRPRRLPRSVLAAGEVERVLRRPDVSQPLGLRDRAMFETLYATGLRRGELVGLALPDLDIGRQTVWVRHGKGGRDRVVPIAVRALEWIGAWVTEGRPRFVRGLDPGWVFLSRRGRQVRPNRVSELARTYLRAAGLAGRGSSHLFRHTAATLMLEGGADIRYIQALLGHAQLASTEVYTHVSIMGLRAVYERTHPAAGGGAGRTLTRSRGEAGSSGCPAGRMAG